MSHMNTHTSVDHPKDTDITYVCNFVLSGYSNYPVVPCSWFLSTSSVDCCRLPMICFTIVGGMYFFHNKQSMQLDITGRRLVQISPSPKLLNN